MLFTWTPEKKLANPRKHRGITFEMAQEVFEDPRHVTSENYQDGGEQRYQVIGLTRGALLLLVVFVDRSKENEEILHMISARKATAYEKGVYQDQFR